MENDAASVELENPDSPSAKIATIWLSVNFDFLISSP
jgi:hypothetical protein